MIILYRLSDKSCNKLKIPGCTKDYCLNNFLSNLQSNYKFYLILDNCNKETIIKYNYLENIIITNLGNSNSFLYTLQFALNNFNNEIIYFVEDDYLHKKDSLKLINEGLEYFDYVSLYDHPDKYLEERYEDKICKLLKTENTHWKSSVSTTMTFASKVKTLKRDYHIWEKYTKNFNYPQDHNAFVEINGFEATTSKLGISIPGNSEHIDLTLSKTKNKDLISQWAWDLIINSYLEKISNFNFDLIKNKNNFSKCAVLEILSSKFN